MQGNPDKSKGLYFIALIPPEDLERDLWEIKKELSSRFDTRAALRSPPHITLHMPFRYRLDRQESLIESLTAFARTQSPFSVELNGFNAFPPRVIYVDVLSSKFMNELQGNLLDFMKREHNIFNANYRDLPFRPHLTVAFRDLKKSRFEEAWESVRDRSLKMSWKCESICLLWHNGKSWVRLHEAFLCI